MEGWIKIEDYRVVCKMGVYPHEKKEEREILVTVQLKVDFSKCIETDSIHDTLNYALIGTLCESIAKSKHYNLLETYVYELLETVFHQFKEVKKARISVKKPHAIALASFVSIELEKERS
jgi:dihydroneopterin aldolase